MTVTTEHPAFEEAETQVRDKINRMMAIKGDKTVLEFHRELGLTIQVHRGARFFHLERQSVGSDEARDQIRAKLVATNAVLHHLRWSNTIASLKQAAA